MRKHLSQLFSTSSVLSADLPFNMAAVIVLADDKLVVNFLFQFGYMGDNANQFVTVGQAFEYFYGLAAGMVIERAKTFIDEHDIQIDGRTAQLNLVG